MNDNNSSRRLETAGSGEPLRLNMNAVKRWLSVEVQLRLARGWLVGAGLLVFLLLALALD